MGVEEFLDLREREVGKVHWQEGEQGTAEEGEVGEGVGGLRVRERSSPQRASRRQWLRISTPAQWPWMRASHCVGVWASGSALDR